MSAPLEGDPVKARMKAAWMAGDYGVVAQCAEPGALEIFAGWKIAPGSRMLDVLVAQATLPLPPHAQVSTW